MDGNAAGHAPLVEVLRLADRAWAEHAGHLALHELAGHHLADLVPQGHAAAGVEEATDVRGRGVVWNAAHGQPAGSAETTPGQGDPEQRGRLLGVGTEHLVEVAEARQDEAHRGSAT